jgi:hypothetical protein
LKVGRRRELEKRKRSMYVYLLSLKYCLIYYLKHAQIKNTNSTYKKISNHSSGDKDDRLNE